MTESANLIQEIIRTTQNIRKIHDEFNKNIFENKYFINLEFLLSSSYTVDFKQTWQLNPQKFCYDEYEIPELYPVVLMVNRLNSMFEFKSDTLKNKIVTPPLMVIYKILSLKS